MVVSIFLISQFTTSCPPLAHVYMFFLYICALFPVEVHLYHFSCLYIYVLGYKSFFSPSGFPFLHEHWSVFPGSPSPRCLPRSQNSLKCWWSALQTCPSPPKYGLLRAGVWPRALKRWPINSYWQEIGRKGRRERERRTDGQMKDKGLGGRKGQGWKQILLGCAKSIETNGDQWLLGLGGLGDMGLTGTEFLSGMTKIT